MPKLGWAFATPGALGGAVAKEDGKQCVHLETGEGTSVETMLLWSTGLVPKERTLTNCWGNFDRGEATAVVDTTQLEALRGSEATGDARFMEVRSSTKNGAGGCGQRPPHAFSRAQNNAVAVSRTARLPVV